MDHHEFLLPQKKLEELYLLEKERWDQVEIDVVFSEEESKQFYEKMKRKIKKPYD